MIDRSIPFYNTLLRCDAYREQAINLPAGFRIVTWQPGLERDWARMEAALGDFANEAEAEDYFRRTYLDADRPDDLFFVLNEAGQAAGTCLAWTDERQGKAVNSLHWLVVEEKYQRRGLGRALCTAVMNRFYELNAAPIYIHTQPWSYKAILLYHDLGFRLLKTDTFAAYTNQYEDALKTLSTLLTDEQMERLVSSAIP